MAVDNALLQNTLRRRTPADIAAERTPVVPPSNGSAAVAVAEPAGQEPAKKFDPLPQPGEPYRACARFGDRLQEEQKLLHFVLKDGTLEGFAYSDLRRVRLVQGDHPGASPVLILRFVEAAITDVEIRGRHLRNIHHYISLGVMPWVWEFPGNDFEDEKMPVITRISITAAKG